MGIGGWLLLLGAVWVVASLKQSRPDGDVVRTHPYRRIMFYIMNKRNESIVYFDEKVDARPLLAYLDKARPQFGANITHCVVAAGEICLASNPHMNRFVAARRLYQRRGRTITFSMKRARVDDSQAHREKLATVKLKTSEPRTFAELVRDINAQITDNRSGRKTYADKEFALFDALPRPVFEIAVRLITALDRYNLLPGFFIDTDPLYTSMFIANLGSLGMGAAYHHLYEYGNCPSFVMVGGVNDEPRVIDGAVEVVPTLHLRFSYDERIDDGMAARNGIRAILRVLQEPERWLGCLQEDGGDTHHLWPQPEWESEGFRVWD